MLNKNYFALQQKLLYDSTRRDQLIAASYYYMTKWCVYILSAINFVRRPFSNTECR